MQEKIWKLTWWWTWQLWLVLKELQLVSLEACSTERALASARQNFLYPQHNFWRAIASACSVEHTSEHFSKVYSVEFAGSFGHLATFLILFLTFDFIDSQSALINVWTFFHELGKYHGSIVTNDENMELWCVKAGQNSADLVHPMPYSPELHFREFNSAIADAKNSVAVRTYIS